MLLVGERLAEDDAVDPGDLAGAGGKLGHGLHVPELVRGGARRLVGAGGAHDWPARGVGDGGGGDGRRGVGDAVRSNSRRGQQRQRRWLPVAL